MNTTYVKCGCEGAEHSGVHFGCYSFKKNNNLLNYKERKIDRIITGQIRCHLFKTLYASFSRLKL
jgi:hypothetical protein